MVTPIPTFLLFQAGTTETKKARKTKATSQFASESNNLVNKAMGAGVMKELGSITSAASQFEKLSETVKPIKFHQKYHNHIFTQLSIFVKALASLCKAVIAIRNLFKFYVRSQMGAFLIYSNVPNGSRVLASRQAT